MKQDKPKSRAADNAALRARRKAQGLVHYREWVTPDEKAKLVEGLAELRQDFIKSREKTERNRLMANLRKLWIESDLSNTKESTQEAIRIDWDNDRHQRIEIKGRNPLQLISALKLAVRELEIELSRDKI